MKKIKILPKGPYEVTGGVPLARGEIAPNSRGILGVKKLKDYRPENPENYHLCRCGKSKNKPFCDGTHVKTGFEGKEVASKQKYMARAKMENGESLDLADDGRCAFARFCHRERGEVWTLAEQSGNSENRKEAIAGANACPAGRLTVFDKNGKALEEVAEESIFIMEDPDNPNVPCSAGIFVSGKIPLEGADGTTYEVRNKYALCRCGKSTNTPFCDATHVSSEFNDEEE